MNEEQQDQGEVVSVPLVLSETTRKEFAETDRLKLCDKALRLIDLMLAKQTAEFSVDPSTYGVGRELVVLNNHEQDAYHSALAYLQKQFSEGAFPAETVVMEHSRKIMDDADE